MSQLPIGVLDELRDRLRRAELVADTCADEGIDFTKPPKFIRATLREVERLLARRVITIDEVERVTKAMDHIRSQGWGAP